MSRKINVEDAASRYGVTERTIHRWVADHNITKYIHPLDLQDVMYDDDELNAIANPKPAIFYKDVDWERANCRGLQTDLFFLEDDLLRRKFLEFSQVRAVCFRCPIRQQCLEWAYANDERYGMMGGVSGVERRLVAQGKFNDPFLSTLKTDIKAFGGTLESIVEASKYRRASNEVSA
jgi:WhiB family redox-sensing transcriptional regulator